MTKLVKATALILLICFLFSGCSFRISSSIDELISPISPFGDNADIKKALDDYATAGYSLKTPAHGNYISSYNFFDFNADKTDEAVAFYEPADNLGTISMAVIQKLGDKWTVTDNISGDGKDIYSVDFDDITGDGKNELLICWDLIRNSTNHELSIYSVSFDDSGTKLNKLGNSISINNYIIADLIPGDASELLLFELLSGNSSSAKAELYSVNESSMVLLSDTRLDSHITSYEEIKLENAENDLRVYADALGSDGSSMLTEVIYWSTTYNSIVSPFYDYSTGQTSDTRRLSMINSSDINNDSLIEIPTDCDLVSDIPEEISAVDWLIYKNTTLIHSAYSLLVRSDGYNIVIPAFLINGARVLYNSDRSEMTLVNKNTNKTVFSVIPVLKATFNEGDYPGYVTVLQDSGYIYLAKQGDDEELQFTAQDISENIKAVNIN